VVHEGIPVVSADIYASAGNIGDTTLDGAESILQTNG
jgi:hypothetical protein